MYTGICIGDRAALSLLSTYFCGRDDTELLKRPPSAKKWWTDTVLLVACVLNTMYVFFFFCDIVRDVPVISIRSLDPFGTPKPLPILIPSNLSPKTGFYMYRG